MKRNRRVEDLQTRFMTAIRQCRDHQLLFSLWIHTGEMISLWLEWMNSGTSNRKENRLPFTRHHVQNALHTSYHSRLIDGSRWFPQFVSPLTSRVLNYSPSIGRYKLFPPIKNSSRHKIGIFESFIITTLKWGKNTQTHAHLKVTCAQRGWLLFAGMARGILSVPKGIERKKIFSEWW